MDPIALRPRKATEIIDAAIEVYRRNPIHFLLLAAMVRVPWLIAQIVYLAPVDGDPEMLFGMFVIAFGTMFTTLLMAGFVVKMASDLYLGQETDAFSTIRSVASRVPAVFVASLMQIVCVSLGFMLLLFPAVWVSAVLFAVLPVVVLERRNPFAAFDRSSQLSNGVKWHVLSALGLVAIIWFVVVLGSAIITQIIPMPALKYSVAAAADILLYPLFGIASTLIYYDVRIRKEGFDIEMMAGQPTTAPAASA
jgi:hypothetical protein